MSAKQTPTFSAELSDAEIEAMSLTEMKAWVWDAFKALELAETQAAVIKGQIGCMNAAIHKRISDNEM